MRSGKAFDVALDSSVASLAEPDRRLAHELAAGVLRQRSVLDSHLAPLVPRGWSSVAPELQDILRLGAYQLTSLDRVPSHAAVDTSVELAKENGGARPAAFVNAVLRRLAGTETRAPTLAGDDAERLAAEHSHPVWLVRRWVDLFGLEAAERLLRWNNTRPRLVLQPARQDSESLAERWRAAGIEVEPAPYGAGLVTALTRPSDLPGFGEGDFIVQDPAQALLGTLCRPPAGSRGLRRLRGSRRQDHRAWAPGQDRRCGRVEPCPGQAAGRERPPGRKRRGAGDRRRRQAAPAPTGGGCPARRTMPRDRYVRSPSRRPLAGDAGGTGIAGAAPVRAARPNRGTGGDRKGC